MSDYRKTRRDFIKQSVAAGAAAMAGPGLVADALANRHPHPRTTSLPHLDRNMYRRNTEVLAIFDQGHHRGAKMQMMAAGHRRYLFLMGDVVDVTGSAEADAREFEGLRRRAAPARLEPEARPSGY
jgi:hypothetical protein